MIIIMIITDCVLIRSRIEENAFKRKKVAEQPTFYPD